MSNGARHALGILAGLVLTPVVAGALVFGTARALNGMEHLRISGTDHYVGIGVLAGAALLLGVLVGSRLSPLASLIGGLAFTAVGVVWAVIPRWISDRTTGRLPDEFDQAYVGLGLTGLFLIVGVLLLVASLFPARWRSLSHTDPDAQPRPSYEYGLPDTLAEEDDVRVYEPGQDHQGYDPAGRHARDSYTPPQVPLSLDYEAPGENQPTRRIPKQGPYSE